MLVESKRGASVAKSETSRRHYQRGLWEKHGDSHTCMQIKCVLQFGVIEYGRLAMRFKLKLYLHSNWLKNCFFSLFTPMYRLNPFGGIQVLSMASLLSKDIIKEADVTKE